MKSIFYIFLPCVIFSFFTSCGSETKTDNSSSEEEAVVELDFLINGKKLPKEGLDYLKTDIEGSIKESNKVFHARVNEEITFQDVNDGDDVNRDWDIKADNHSDGEAKSIKYEFSKEGLHEVELWIGNEVIRKLVYVHGEGEEIVEMNEEEFTQDELIQEESTQEKGDYVNNDMTVKGGNSNALADNSASNALQKQAEEERLAAAAQQREIKRKQEAADEKAKAQQREINEAAKKADEVARIERERLDNEIKEAANDKARLAEIEKERIAADKKAEAEKERLRIEKIALDKKAADEKAAFLKQQDAERKAAEERRRKLEEDIAKQKEIDKKKQLAADAAEKKLAEERKKKYEVDQARRLKEREIAAAAEKKRIADLAAATASAAASVPAPPPPAPGEDDDFFCTSGSKSVGSSYSVCDSKTWTEQAVIKFTPKRKLKLSKTTVSTDNNGQIEFKLTYNAGGNSYSENILRSVNKGKSEIYLDELDIVMNSGVTYTLSITSKENNGYKPRLENNASCGGGAAGSSGDLGIDYKGNQVLFNTKYCY